MHATFNNCFIYLHKKIFNNLFFTIFYQETIPEISLIFSNPKNNSYYKKNLHL